MLYLYFLCYIYSFCLPCSNGGKRISQEASLSPPHVVRALQCGTSYNFSVTAANRIGSSGPSGYKEAMSQLRICRPNLLPLRRGHLDIKDAQCAENKDGRKISYHISRLSTTDLKEAFWAPKNSIFFKCGQICRKYWN